MKVDAAAERIVLAAEEISAEETKQKESVRKEETQAVEVNIRDDGGQLEKLAMLLDSI